MAEIGGIPKVYVREGPGTEFSTIATLDAGAPVDILDVEGSWTKIQTREGKVGFVYHKYVIPGPGTAPHMEPASKPEPTRAIPPASVAAPIAAAPLAAPTANPESPALAPAPPPRDDLTVEVSRLRSEIADLKREIQDRAAEMEVTRATQSARGIVSPIPATGAGSSTMSASEQSAGALAVGFLALLVGWVLGSAFTRRRSRSQRPRLRF